MSPVTLEEGTLGEKHRHFNKLVEDAIADENYELRNIISDHGDIDNLLKIAIASRNRNIDYIIEVIKSNDMLYAATAIKKSTWLVTEPQYANIINPEYLHTQLLPSMNTKTFNKLMLHIRLNLKDERRVETFYDYLKGRYSSYKWLQNCSISFIENVIRQDRPIPLCLFKRLCRRSGRCLKLYTRVEEAKLPDAKYEIFCYLKSHTADVLKVLEDFDYFPGMGKKKTKLLMKYCPLKIINHFDRYGRCEQVDVSVVAQYLEKTELKDFLFKQVKHHQDYNILRPFINNMPEEERFEFVRKTFIDKTELSQFCTEEDKDMIESCIKPYQWYEFAPFKVAKQELRKLILAENSPPERFAMLLFLITCARNPQDIKTMLKYFKDKHINEPFKFKIQFVNYLLSQVSTHKFDVETWYVLDQLFHSMEVYTESNNNVQMCLQSIVLYNVLHDKSVPEIIEQKFSFNTFKDKRRNLNQEQMNKIFAYLLNYLLIKIQSINILNESDFNDTLHNLKNVLTLLRDWGKDISKYPSVLQKIQELIKIRQERMWETDMSCLYNVKKSWRKHMFEESLSLCLSEEACLNALKHKPQLLTRHDKQIDTLQTDDAVSLRRLLAKLRVYWPHSLAQHFTGAYLLHLNKPTGQKAVVRGLFMLIPQNQVIDMAKKYIPVDYKIHWGETGQVDISIRKNIAQNLHVARPLIPLDTILWYAEGDYLQYAVPSVNARLSILSEVECREHVSKLLEASVSLQKFGIKLAISKLEPADLKSIFLKIWSTTRNLTIRSVLFKHTYAWLCKVKNPSLEKDSWELLSFFIDNLSAEESTDIYTLLGTAENIPISLRAQYFMKGYTFLTSLPASANCESFIQNLIKYAPTIMDLLDEHFVSDKLLSPAISKFCTIGSKFVKVFACYVLCGKTEEEQLQRFKKVVNPAINEDFRLWNDESIQNNFNIFLKTLVWNFRVYYCTIKIPIPATLFVDILTKMKKKLSLINNYVLYTSWKLITEYFTLMKKKESSFLKFALVNSEQHFKKRWNSIGLEHLWYDIHVKISRSFGPIVIQCLKKDTEQYNCPTIYCPFTDAFEKMFELLAFSKNYFIHETLSYMLNEREFIPSYLMVAKVLPKYYGTERTRLRRKIESHQSAVVRIHYYTNFLGISFD